MAWVMGSFVRFKRGFSLEPNARAEGGLLPFFSSSDGRQTPQRGHFTRAGIVQGVAGVGHFGVLRLGVDAAHHLQAVALKRGQQFFAGAQTQVLCQVGQDQPAFAFGGEVGRQTFQKTGQHAAAFVVHRMLQR